MVARSDIYDSGETSGERKNEDVDARPTGNREIGPKGAIYIPYTGGMDRLKFRSLPFFFLRPMRVFSGGGKGPAAQVAFFCSSS